MARWCVVSPAVQMPHGSSPHRPSVVSGEKNEVSVLHRAERKLPVLFLLVWEDVTAEAGKASRVRRRVRVRVRLILDMAQFPFLGAGRGGPDLSRFGWYPPTEDVPSKGNRDRLSPIVLNSLYGIT